MPSLPLLMPPFLPGRFTACVLTVIAAGAMHCHAAELLNPGFEEDTTNWNSQWNRGMSETIADAARSGNAGLRISDDRAHDVCLVTSIPIEAFPGKTYSVSFWARTISSQGGGKVGVSMTFRDEKGKSLRKKPQVTWAPSDVGEWKQYTATEKAPENAITVDVTVRSNLEGQVTADIDDLEIKESE